MNYEVITYGSFSDSKPADSEHGNRESEDADKEDE